MGSQIELLPFFAHRANPTLALARALARARARSLSLASGRLGSLDMLDSASQAAAETRIRKVGLRPLMQRKPAQELHSVNSLIRLGDKSPGRARWARAPLLYNINIINVVILE